LARPARRVLPHLQTTLVNHSPATTPSIWLQTGAALGHYDGDRPATPAVSKMTPPRSNPACSSANSGRHPCIKHVGAYPTIGAKIEAVRAVIDGLLAKPE